MDVQTARQTTVEPFSIAELADSFELACQAKNLSPETLRSYRTTLQQFEGFLREQGMPTAAEHVKREHVEAFIRSVLECARASTALTRYRSLRVFWSWTLEEDEVTRSPMERMKPPKMEDVPPPVLTEDQVRALLRVTGGRDFESRRDHAIFRLWLDTGLRRSELAGLRVEDVDFGYGVVRVLGKGRQVRGSPFGRKAAQALDRYLRVRRRHRDAGVAGLWLGRRGPLSTSGIYEMVRRRGAEAGTGPIHPHLFRHTLADRWLRAGGTEGDLAAIGGWRSRTAMARYGRSAAASRAREAHRRLSPGDRL